MTLLLYAAPMEGITNYMYRTAHADWFGGADKYYMPFISANHTLSLQQKEIDDISPENNRDGSRNPLPAVPQILTNEPFCFIVIFPCLYNL